MAALSYRNDLNVLHGRINGTRMACHPLPCYPMLIFVIYLFQGVHTIALSSGAVNKCGAAFGEPRGSQVSSVTAFHPSSTRACAHLALDDITPRSLPGPARHQDVARVSGHLITVSVASARTVAAAPTIPASVPSAASTMGSERVSSDQICARVAATNSRA